MEVLMLVNEVIAADKLIGIKFKARKKKKNNPAESKTTKMGSFIDVFGGMAGYSEPGKTVVNPATQST